MGVLSGVARRGVTKKLGIGAVGFGVMDGAMTFYDRRQQHPDESVGTSAVIAGANAAAWAVLPGPMFAWEAYKGAKALGEAGVFNKEMQQSKMHNYYAQGGSWNYQDTQMAATMRQRGLEAITNGRMAAKSAFGGEARALHRGAL